MHHKKIAELSRLPFNLPAHIINKWPGAQPYSLFQQAAYWYGTENFYSGTFTDLQNISQGPTP
jgi:hypothetical protein